MSEESIIIVDDGPDDSDVVFVTSVTKESDCIFVEEVNNSSSARVTSNTSDAPVNLSKRPIRENREQKFPSKQKHTSDASTSTGFITTESHSAENGITCCVCYEPKSLDFNCFYSTMCGHIYCSGCIDKIINFSKSCAVCRKKLTKKQYHRVFL